MKEMSVEVLNLARNFDVESGKPSVVVSFGNCTDSTPDVRERGLKQVDTQLNRIKQLPIE